MRLRRLSLFATLVAGLLLLWYWSVLTSPIPIEIAEQGMGQSRAAATTPLSIDTRRHSSGAADTEPEPLRIEANPRTAPKLMGIQGTFVVTDAEGGLHRNASGKFTLKCWTAGVARSIEIEVSNGTWTASVEPFQKYSYGSAWLGGQFVLCDEPRRLVRLGSTLSLEGKWGAATILRVIAADTHADLQDVTVVRQARGVLSLYSHPGNQFSGRVVVNSVSSPVRIAKRWDGNQRPKEYLVHAPGYAWGSIKLAHEAGGTREIRLKRGGGFDVLINAASLPKGAVLRFRRHLRLLDIMQRPADATDARWQRALDEFSAAPTETLPAAQVKPNVGELTHVRGMVPGIYSIALEQGDDLIKDSVVLGTTKAQLRVGETALVTIELDSTQKKPATVPVAGTVHVPSAWKSDDIHIEFLLINETKPWSVRPKIVWHRDMKRSANGEYYSWDAGGLVPGVYDVTLDPMSVRKRVTIGSAGIRHLRLEAPQPNDVFVKVIDQATRKKLVPTNLRWLIRSPSGHDSWGWNSIQIGGSKGTGRFQAPLGKIHFSVELNGYALLNESGFEVLAGRNEFTLELERSCGVEITVRVGNARLPWDWMWMPRLSKIDGKGHGGVRRNRRIAVTGPGEYVLSMQPIKGYEPIQKRNVTILPGKWTKVDIPLVRIR